MKFNLFWLKKVKDCREYLNWLTEEKPSGWEAEKKRISKYIKFAVLQDIPYSYADFCIYQYGNVYREGYISA